MTDIKNYSLEELQGVIKGWGAPLYLAKEIFRWIYQKKAVSFDAMTNLSLALRKQLTDNFTLCELKIVKIQESADRTKKYLFSLEDGALIESVLIPAKDRNTACLSTQVGCKYGCSFCASGAMGFKRDLTVSEIISQALVLDKEAGLSNIVFMGMGEPFDNYENTLKAVRTINAKEGMNIGARKITISTSGVIPGIEKLMKEGIQVELSVSLHSADDKIRSQLMPVNRKYPLAELINTCRRYVSQTHRQITFEYTLIRGINSSSECADKLVRLLKDWDTKVNLIIYNAVKQFPYQEPTRSEILSFRERLEMADIPVTIRISRGQDIQGACGQLSGAGEGS